VTVLSIVEHAEISVGEAFSAEPADPTIGHRHAWLIERLNRRLEDRGSPAPFELGYRSVKARHYCGVIALGPDAIEILPKIDSAESGGSATEARVRLLTMLAVARRLPLHPADVARMARGGDSLLEIFLCLFAAQALTVIRSGLVHRYERMEDELRVVRGKISHALQATSNAARPDRIWCAFDEFTPDNGLNRAIKAAAVRGISVGALSSTQSALREVVYSLEGVSDVAPRVDEFRAFPRDRLTRSYREVVDLAGSILFGPTPDVVSGRESHVALLFDMNKLFEEFIGRLILDLTSEGHLEISLQGPRRWLGTENEKIDRFLLRPDVVLAQHGVPVGVIDTKWKRLPDEDPASQVSEADAYQMLAYMTSYKTSSGALLYPWSGESDVLSVKSEIMMEGKRLIIAGVNLRDMSLVPTQLEALIGAIC